MITDFPVEGFPMKFSWQEGDWELLFNEQIELIKEDIFRARVQGKMVIYLSCPISSRGGGYSGTNIEITEFTRMKLLKEWGTGFWILNPANYQMESKGGTGLMHRHAKKIWGQQLGDQGAEDKLNNLVNNSPAKDGDYMRMWTKVLVEDNEPSPLKNSGSNFNGFYFLGTTDVKSYFLNSEDGDLTSSIQSYFSRKFALDSDFRDSYSIKNISWGIDYDANAKPIARSADEEKLVQTWEKLRLDFFKFYSLKASVNFSLGSHDEWNIWFLLNQKRIEVLDRKTAIGNLVPGFFEGRQVTPVDFCNRAISGYEIEK